MFPRDNYVDRALDKIYSMILRMNNNDPQKNKVLTEYLKYRQEFEESIESESFSTVLGYNIMQFEINLGLYMSGQVSKATTERKTIPILHTEKDDTELQEKIKRYGELLKQLLDSDDIRKHPKLRAKILRFANTKYNEIPRLKSQEFERKLAEAKFVLMIDYLKSERYKEAQKLSETFDIDMQNFLKEHLLGKVETLRNKGHLQEVLYILKYVVDEAPIEKPNAREKKLSFWEKIINIEDPEHHFSIPKETMDKYDNPPTAVPEKKSLLRIIKDMVERRKKVEVIPKLDRVKVYSTESIEELLESVKGLSIEELVTKLITLQKELYELETTYGRIRKKDKIETSPNGE